MRALWVLLFALMSSLAWADAPAPEYSMSATGRIEIGPDGAVRELKLDSGLSAAVRGLIEKAVASWRFEPILVDGRAVIASTRMTLALDAYPVEDGRYRIQLSHAYFGTPQPRGRIVPPKYPRSAIHQGLGARVLLQARLDAQGNVIDVHPYQTSLSRTERPRTAQRFRERFEAVSVAAAKRWQYEPAELIDGEATGRTVMIPVMFEIVPSAKVRRNYWSRFIPGPISPAPWIDASTVAVEPNGLNDGDAAALDSRFKLIGNVTGESL